MDTASIYVLLFLLAGVASWYVIPRRWLALLSWIGRRISGFRSKTIRVDGLRWHYLEGGKGDTTLVLLHGLAGECDHWLGVAGQLRRQFHLLIPDLPGFGASEPPAQLSFTIEAQSRRLEAWLDQLGVNDCILAGNSMGGWMAANFADRRPERVRALWLMNPFGVLSAEPSEMLTGFAEGRNPFVVGSLSDFRDLAEMLFFKTPHLPYPVARANFLNTRRLAGEFDRMQVEVLQQSEPLESIAPRLKMPVLIEWGREDRAVDVSGAAILDGLLEDVEVVVHDECGHLPMLECPTKAGSAFRRFARRIGLLSE